MGEELVGHLGQQVYFPQVSLLSLLPRLPLLPHLVMYFAFSSFQNIRPLGGLAFWRFSDLVVGSLAVVLAVTCN